jgi:hypothetical protein
MKKNHKIIVGGAVLLGIGYYVYANYFSNDNNLLVSTLIKNGIADKNTPSETDAIFLNTFKELKYTCADNSQYLKIILQLRSGMEKYISDMLVDLKKGNKDKLATYSKMLNTEISTICPKLGK